MALLIHDDGSLTRQDAERLEAALPGVEILWREEADRQVLELLSDHPACRAFREANPLGLKLLDILLLETGGTLAYCDADVLFLRPFKGLFHLPSDEVCALFMADSQNAYSLRSWHLALNWRLLPASSVNTGIITFRKEAWDLDLIERFLLHPQYHRRTPVWAEQTAWALLGGAAAGCHLYDSLQVRFPTIGPPAPADTVALHFISPLRGRLSKYLMSLTAAEETEPVRMNTVRTGRCGVLELFGTELRRRIGRL